jgi:hypothetical protein
MLLFAPGCGDTTTTPDMPVSVMDMTVPLTCQGIFNCAKNCLVQTDIVGCANKCAAGVPTTSPAATQFGKLEQCLFMFCVLDASTNQIAGCVNTALQDSTKCMSQLAACQ